MVNKKVNLDHYIDSFWLVGLALTLDIPEDQWQRLLSLIGNEGADELLDRIIATCQPNRKIGRGVFCYPQPHQLLLDAVNVPKGEQTKLLFNFVKKWYKGLKQPRKKGLSKSEWPFREPFWYDFGDEQGIKGGAYFGYWCIEAVAAVKAFGLDDSLCLGHEYYPGDLLRPNGPSTHPVREESSMLEDISNDKSQEQGKGFFTKLFSS